jgi:integrase
MRGLGMSRGIGDEASKESVNVINGGIDHARQHHPARQVFMASQFDVGTDANGKRIIQYETVHGTRKAAEVVLAKRLNELADGRYVAPTVETVETYALHWLAHIAPAGRADSSVERYRTLIRAHIIPMLGSIPLQKLDGKAIDRFYAHLRKADRRHGGGLASVSLHNVHRMLSQLLKSAVKAKLIARSPIDDVQTKTKPKRKKVEVLDEGELACLLAHLKGHWLYMPTLLAAYTGLRRGEVLALRWKDINFVESLTVAQSVDIVRGKLVVAEPKTDRSRRTIKLPARPVPELKQHRKEQAAMRLQLGLGKDSADLVFTSAEGEMLSPTALSVIFARQVRATGVKKTKFHGLRHLHITHLLRSGVPVHVVSARAGHARPSVTLDTYSHLLGAEDAAAADLADAMLRRALK